MTVGGIMAGGIGKRLRDAGVSKPLLPVAGKPIVVHVLDQFRDAGISRIVAETRRSDCELIEVLIEYCAGRITLELVHAPDSLGTGTSLREILEVVNGEDCLISTVDTIAPAFAYKNLMDFTHRQSFEIAAVILATTFVHDEAPIWIQVADDGETVTDLGKMIAPTARCFGNVRWLSQITSNILLEYPRATPGRDMIMMRDILTRMPGMVKQLTINPIFDIDTIADAQAAEQWLDSLH
jgi:choline kinase